MHDQIVKDFFEFPGIDYVIKNMIEFYTINIRKLSIIDMMHDEDG